MSSSLTARAQKKAIAPRAQTSGGALRSTVAMAAGVLAPCPQCGVTGPKRLLDEHVRRDHPERAAAPSDELRPIKVGGQKLRASGCGQFVVSIAPRYRERLEQERTRSGRPFAHIIAAALDKYLEATP